MKGPRVAIISDTVDDTNGVAIGLRRLVAASTRAGRSMSLVGPANAKVSDEVVRIPAAMSASLPFYPDYVWSVPELPALVSYLSRSADIVQIATPGPMGIAGLIAARMVGLPAIAQYHTEVADYAAQMTGMPMIRGIVEPLVGWVYKQAELCLAPSAAVEQRLVGFGVERSKIQRVQRGVDLDLFTPAKRDRSVLANYQLGDGPVALYVGRLSKEKNLDGLLAAWATVHASRPHARLLIVGDGPQAAACDKPGVVRAGSLFGDDLARVFASCDAFAFASETETFGNVVVEAGASGLPAVVLSGGAAKEHVIDGETGAICRDRDSFVAALGRLLDDRALREHQGRIARARVQSYDLDRAVRATWAIYDQLIANRPTFLQAVAS
jgi:glycosyltransferase involved in cell wall biosynthesis